MSDEASNAASESLHSLVAFVNEFGFSSEEWVRAVLTDDFAYQDRRHGPNFPDADAESYPKYAKSVWDTGAGQPRFEYEVLAVRGERFAAGKIRLDYGNGMLFESINVVALDVTLSLTQRIVDFGIDDVDDAIAELDRLHGQADAN